MSYAKRSEPLIQPLQGDQSNEFDLTLVRESLASLEQHRKEFDQYDDFAFQTHMRFLASLFYFVGGKEFAEKLSVSLRHVSVPTIQRWLNGQSAPAPSVRNRAVLHAERLLRHVVILRNNGASLFDLTSASE